MKPIIVDTKIDGVEILSLVIDFYCTIPLGCLNLGLVTIKHEGRSYVLDTVSSKWSEENNHTTVTVFLEKFEEDEDSKFDLTKWDLHEDNLDVKLWLEEAIEVADGHYVDPESITLFVRFPNEDGSGMTKAINVTIE
jgi:hypothetical protein